MDNISNRLSTNNNIEDRYQQLNKKLNDLKNNKNKKEARLEQVNAELEKCLLIAKEKYGVSNIDELRDLLNKYETEEKEAFEVAVLKTNNLEQALKDIDEQLIR